MLIKIYCSPFIPYKLLVNKCQNSFGRTSIFYL
nr:MAG TPA: hypothetical protein [Caudoviricetes sp.]